MNKKKIKKKKLKINSIEEESTNPNHPIKQTSYSIERVTSEEEEHRKREVIKGV